MGYCSHLIRRLSQQFCQPFTPRPISSILVIIGAFPNLSASRGLCGFGDLGLAQLFGSVKLSRRRCLGLPHVEKVARLAQQHSCFYDSLERVALEMSELEVCESPQPRLETIIAFSYKTEHCFGVGVHSDAWFSVSNSLHD
ncbi:unnamed protein product [Protopolystoma xenopodis]|uniref:Uncharacterized protein n=1 Tax=Protopolystoma xenopodis TaxID=117903 RepID=A0A448WF98_9PLAT|nr:unnamed protein product [Protopolystoma xenopodis]